MIVFFLVTPLELASLNSMAGPWRKGLVYSNEPSVGLHLWTTQEQQQAEHSSVPHSTAHIWSPPALLDPRWLSFHFCSRSDSPWPKWLFSQVPQRPLLFLPSSISLQNRLQRWSWLFFFFNFYFKLRETECRWRKCGRFLLEAMGTPMPICILQEPGPGCFLF